ncbi:MAG: MOFRL family protein, partial [Candidatus Thermoplasmatota archaeon]|nr:MOFRL family protein [Candidatus Thermoplasmatota archaeon]
ALCNTFVEPIQLDEARRTFDLLLKAGADVQDMNTVRKHLSEIKGGRLAARCQGEVITLGLCDVPSKDATDIGSGPTVGDPTSFQTAWSIVDRVGTENFPPVVVEHLDKGRRGAFPDTPAPGDGRADGPVAFLGTNKYALDAAEARAQELGYELVRLPSALEGEARVQGATLGKRILSEGQALLAGGETTVTLRPDHEGGPGLGGRNQELTLACAMQLHDVPVAVCGFGTDGIDGPTDAAGAIADGRTLRRGLEAKRDAEKHLAANDAYTYFASLGDLIRTGPTGTNVMDLFIGLVEPEA